VEKGGALEILRRGTIKTGPRREQGGRGFSRGGGVSGKREHFFGGLLFRGRSDEGGEESILEGSTQVTPARVGDWGADGKRLHDGS